MTIDLKGRQILGYSLVELIDEGGMGSVWRAEHRDLGNVRAVKVLDPLLARDPDLVKRFVQEAKTQVRLGHHPNIVQVENFSRQDLAMLMEYVDGHTLAELIGRKVGAIPHERALPWMLQILSALEYAHGKGVIHRDIKPSNIVLASSDKAAKVLDFGIAKVMQSAVLTLPKDALGTAMYIAPEQVRNPGGVDARADIYSLGVTFYEMLAGRPPFLPAGKGDSDFELKEAHLNELPPDPREHGYEHIPKSMVKVVMRCLEKKPAARYQTVGKLREALGDARGGAAETRIECGSASPNRKVVLRSEPVKTARATGGGDLSGKARPGGRVPQVYVILGVGVVVLLVGVFIWVNWDGKTSTSGPPVGGGRPARVDSASVAQGMLLVEGSPTAALLSITGPEGHRLSGRLGTALIGLSSGKYTVKVSHAEYQIHEATTEVVAGETARLKVNLIKLVEPGKAGIQWVLIPGGSFMMGSDSGNGWNKPAHLVTLPTFRMSKTEVTVGQYRTCLHSGPCTAPATPAGYSTSSFNWNQRGRE